MTRAIHFWDGSNVACGRRSTEYSTERPAMVSCRQCLPAARRAERRWNRVDGALDTPSSPDRTAPGDELAHERSEPAEPKDNDMTTPTPTVDLDLDRLESAARAATPGDLDSAEVTTVGEILCPLCGDGTIDHKAFTNIDGQAIGVEVFGVGEKMADHERFARAFNPATALSLISALRASQQVAKEQAETIGELAAALHPFALEAMEWNTTVSSDFVPEIGEPDGNAGDAKFTVGDLRRAASAYANAMSRTRPSGGDADGEQSQ